MKTPARHYRLTFEQFLAAQRMVRRREFWRFEARIIAATFVAYLTLRLFPGLDRTEDGSLRELVVGVGIALVGYMFVDWMRFKRRASREYEAARSDPPLLYSIRDEGIEFTGSDVYAILPWTRIDHWSENDDTLILLERVPLVGLCPSVVAPKSQLGSEELAFLRQKLAENGVRKR